MTDDMSAWADQKAAWYDKQNAAWHDKQKAAWYDKQKAAWYATNSASDDPWAEKKAAWYAEAAKAAQHAVGDESIAWDTAQESSVRVLEGGKLRLDKEAPRAGSASSAIAKAKAHTRAPLKILVLHGGASDAAAMERMIGNLVVEFGPLVRFSYAQAPNTNEGCPDECLWMGDPTKQSFDPRAADWWQQDSLPYLREYIRTHGPFDGVLGYSMGCASALALLAAVPPSTFRFAVLCCGYVPTNDPVTMAQLDRARPLEVPALHVQGRTDMMTTAGMCDAMLEYFAPDKVELCKHPGGHTHPHDVRHVDQMAAFLLRFVPTEDGEARG